MRRPRSIPAGVNGAARRRAGFTLLELILVMAMLLTVLSLAAPSLARFFRGRGLDSEATRFLALLRHAQSRAVSEGVPVVVWLDPESRLYGLEAESSYVERDDLALEFRVNDQVEVEAELPPAANLLSELLDRAALLPPELDLTVQTERTQAIKNLIWFRFNPDGFLTENLPRWVEFREVRDDRSAARLWVAQSYNRLSYEIRTNPPTLLRR
jgi:type II secretion system protein H